MNNIRTRRRALNLTMKQLSAAVGVTEAAISHYETGRREPDPDMLGRIANALGVTVDYLLGREETPATSPAPQKAPADMRAEAKMLLERMSDDEYQQALEILRVLHNSSRGTK